MKEMSGMNKKVLSFVSAPTEISLEAQGRLPMIHRGTVSCLPCLLLHILQVFWWRAEASRSWNPLFCLQVHQICGSLCCQLTNPFPPSFSRTTFQGEVATWHFWFWLLKCRWKFLGSVSFPVYMAEPFYKRKCFLSFVLFYLPAWNVKMGPRGAVAILPWEDHIFKDEKGLPAKNVEQSWKVLGSRATLWSAFMGSGSVVSKISKWCVILAVCYGLVFVSLDSYTEILTPKVII